MSGRTIQRSPHAQLVIDTIVTRAYAHGASATSEERLRTEVAEIVDDFREYVERRAMHNLRRRAKAGLDRMRGPR